ncbi:MAG: penicillin-binding protein 2 [Planctomycetes bacterium]|nr:penicillin-binding protein 2 [Planctomycetota bacterium]
MKLKYVDPPQQSTNRWGHVCVGIVVLCFAGLSGRLVYLQTAARPRALSHRDRQQTRQVDLHAQRGSIFDTRGRLLAASEPQPSVFGDPQRIKDIGHAASQLAAILGTSRDRLIERIERRRHTRFVWLARKVSPGEAQAVRALDLAGIGIKDESHRFYPNGPALAHVLGFVNIDGVGLEGLELQFNDLLTGEPAAQYAWCDLRRRPIWTKSESSTAPTHGDNLVLTIDLVIQRYVEEALEHAVTQFQAESAVGIVMSPRDGDVIAMAGYPTFDPNYHREYPSAHKRNRCLTDPVEPGSCFKPLIMSAALSEGVARLDETVDCGSGVWFFGSRRMRDTHANGKLTFEDVLIKSSNIGMGHIGTRLGNKALYEYVRAYGFGARTGISLPGESAGILAPVRKWSSYSKTSIPIGQELAVTPIQLATAFAALVNGGTLRPPRLVRMVLDSAGKQNTPDHQPGPPRQVVPPEVADAVAKQALVRMVNASPHDIKLAKYQVLGKTGTAQVPYRNRRGYEPDAFLGSFLGAAPAHDPVVSVLVMIRKPKRSLGYYGGTVAGPAVREIIQKTLAYWDITPDRDPSSVAMLAMKTATE